MTDVLRTFATRPLVVVDRATGDVLGSSGNKAHARALGASEVGENGYLLVDLSDAAGFSEAAANAGDLAGAYVAGLAQGMTVAEIADHYRGRMAPRAIYDDHSRTTVTVRDARHIVASDLREALGSLSRKAARRKVAGWILDGIA